MTFIRYREIFRFSSFNRLHDVRVCVQFDAMDGANTKRNFLSLASDLSSFYSEIEYIF